MFDVIFESKYFLRHKQLSWQSVTLTSLRLQSHLQFVHFFCKISPGVQYLHHLQTSNLTFERFRDFPKVRFKMRETYHMI